MLSFYCLAKIWSVLNGLQDQVTGKLKSSPSDCSGRVRITIAANFLHFLYFHPRSGLNWAIPSSLTTLIFWGFFSKVNHGCVTKFADMYVYVYIYYSFWATVFQIEIWPERGSNSRSRAYRAHALFINMNIHLQNYKRLLFIIHYQKSFLFLSCHIYIVSFSSFRMVKTLSLCLKYNFVKWNIIWAS